MIELRFARALLAATILVIAPHSQSLSQEAGWPTYGGDPGGQRFSQADQINQANISHLRLAWDFVAQTPKVPGYAHERASLETTPVLRDGVLFASSAYDDVYAINAENGHQLWHFLPELKFTTPELIVTSRGVARWPLNRTIIDHSHPCATRVFIGTLDARLLAIDAATGLRCDDFGSHGQVDLTQGLDSLDVPGYSVTSPPTIIGNVVVVGSRVGDNERANAEDGMVRAFDAITGRQLWTWEPIAWRGNTHPRVGAANVWSIISADPELGLFYLPTSAPSLDYYGVARPGDNRDANSVVALDAATGRRVWGFQTVHHDLWDYDVPSEPLLFTFHDGTLALAITTKTGQVFVLDRRTGAPIIPIEERPVPQSTIPNEQSSRTQPFSALPMLNDLSLGDTDLSGGGYTRSARNMQLCRQKLDAIKRDGIYTPPSVQGTLQFPGNLGGVNWGGAAFDPKTQTLYANVNRQPASVRFIPRYATEALWRDVRSKILDWPMGLYFAFAIVLCSAIRQGLRRKRRGEIQLP